MPGDLDAHHAARIVDANFNRAREGLRVLEEYARFVLEDHALSREAKELRHRLARALAHVDGMLTAQRDIAGDVGTRVRTPDEYERAGPRAVSTAAARRTSEALRCIEEYLKVFDVDAAREVESLRYAAYALERRVLAPDDARRAFAEVCVYVLITESRCRADWCRTAELALDGGAGALQLREKTLTDRVLVERATRLASLCRERGALLIINDRPEVAGLSGAHGVHLGQDDLRPAHARRLLGPQALIGCSTHNITQVEASLQEGADYLAVGPMFDSPNKAGHPPAGPGTLIQAAACTRTPLVAIGGISQDNAHVVLAAHPRVVLAVCDAVVGSPDPCGAVTGLRHQVESARRQGRAASGGARC